MLSAFLCIRHYKYANKYAGVRKTGNIILFSGDYLKVIRADIEVLDRNMTLDDIRDYLHPPEEEDDA